MAGEGFMAHAISSLKQNRALLKKRKFKDLRELYQNEVRKTEVEFKKLDAKEWAVLKESIKKQHQNNLRIELMIYILSLVITFCILYYIYWFIVS